jgi:hypothetical protein
MAQIPAIYVRKTQPTGICYGVTEGIWWVKFSILIDHPLAWNVVQEMAHVLNSLSAEEVLPTVFKPISPPPYLNGGPRSFLSWVIECPEDSMSPDIVSGWLEARLPDPVNDPAAWLAEL